MRRNGRFLPLLAFVLGSACAAATPAPLPADYFTRDSVAMNVRPSTDEDDRYTDTIGPDGGQLVTLDAAGNTYTLSVPKDALPLPTTLSMAPLADLKGMPFRGGLKVGVQLEPEGTFFLRPVTLEIAFAKPPDLNSITPFGYTGNGQDFTSTMLKPDPGHFVFVLNHFSGVGFGNSTEAERTAELVRQPLDAQERISKYVQQTLGEERQKQLLGQDSDSSETFAAIAKALAAYEKEVLEPLSKVASQSCAVGTLYVQQVLGLERQRQMIGADSDSGLGVLAKTLSWEGPILRKCLEEETQVCFKTGDFSRLIQWRLAVERQAQLVGASTENAALDTQYAKDLKDCAHFELQLHASLTQQGNVKLTELMIAVNGKTDYAAHVDAMLPLKIDMIGALGIPGELPNGKGTAAYTAYRLSETSHSDIALAPTQNGALGVSGDCTTQGSGTTPGQLVATLIPSFKPASPDINAPDPNLDGLSAVQKRDVMRILAHVPKVGLLAPPRVLDVDSTMLNIDVGQPTEHTQSACKDQGGDRTTWLDTWNTYWKKLQKGAEPLSADLGGQGWALNPWNRTTTFPLKFSADVPTHEDAGGSTFDQRWHLDITVLHTPQGGTP
ncbi:hypothetical protein GCM10008957_19000 [Deinococcus ruber]|uniref:Lipoprotein n=2 Tax=Deinococcus ruber TaxID=1848197 RepID=A0A918F5H2_9DEIO|nr:hypothetical protein GCM10008957_19000 [Deinococcus ruber]